jgi:ABC-type multidrug transport system fused ATPase/permease subunit
MQDILVKAISLLSPSQRKKGAVVVLLLVIQSILDFFSLAFFLPLIVILFQPGLIQRNLIFHEFYMGFDFLSVAHFGVALTIIIFLFIILKTWINQRITFRKASFAYGAGREIASRLADKCLAKNYFEFSQADFSKEVNRMVSAPLAFSNNVIIPAGTLFSEVVVFIMIAVAIALYDVAAFGVVLTVLVPAFFVYSLRKKRASEISNVLRKIYPELLKRGFEIAEGLIDIRSFRKESFFKNKFLKARADLDATLALDHTSQTATARTTEIVAAACMCSMLAYALLVKPDSEEALLLVGIYAGASFRIIPSANRIFASLHQIRTHAHIVEELDTIRVNENSHPSTTISFQKNIIIHQLGFHYPGQPAVINNLNLDIVKGQKIALTGPSGKGKSTLLLMLMQYLNQTSGTVSIDGVPLDASTGVSWRRLCGYAPQRPYVLDNTIAGNIAFGDATPNRDRILSLVRSLELEAWISTLPYGIDTEIGERGVRVSGGQLQRIAVARALYSDPEVLLLDEVTNQLDPATEATIFRSVVKISPDKTIIMITHNQDLLGQFDKVLVLDDGAVRELHSASAQ